MQNLDHASLCCYLPPPVLSNNPNPNHNYKLNPNIPIFYNCSVVHSPPIPKFHKNAPSPPATTNKPFDSLYP